MNIRPLEPGPVQHDDEGDPVPQPAPNSDLTDLIQLLEYGRKKGFRIGPTVRVGKIITTVHDLRQDEGRNVPDDEPTMGVLDRMAQGIDD